MAARIVVACGSGVATSEMVAAKIRKLLEAEGVEAEVVAVEIAEVERALRAGFDADGLAALRDAVKARVALRHLARLAVKLRRVIGAGGHAGAAADALLPVDEDKAAQFRMLRVRLRRADLHAGRIVAVVAGNRHVAVEDILMPCARHAVFAPAP